MSHQALQGDEQPHKAERWVREQAAQPGVALPGDLPCWPTCHFTFPEPVCVAGGNNTVFITQLRGDRPILYISPPETVQGALIPLFHLTSPETPRRGYHANPMIQRRGPRLL